MENKNSKTGRVVVIVLLLIFITISSFIAINMIRMKKDYEKMSKGSFVIKDGLETYMEYGQVVIDKLVKVDGNIYYVDDKGHKVKDTWAIIDNDGHYGYFGNFGDLVINKIRTIDGKDYYFDENGILYQDRTGKKIKIIDGTEYIANNNGELRLATEDAYEVLEESKTDNKVKATTAKTTVASTKAQSQPQPPSLIVVNETLTQQVIEETTIKQNIIQTSTQKSTEAIFANAIDISGNIVSDENGGPGVFGKSDSNTKVKAVSAPGKDSKTTTTVTGYADEVKLTKIEKIEDVYDGDEYECSITLLKPILLGTTEEETEEMNSCIEELMDALMDDIMGTLEEYDTLPKSVTFTSANLTSATNKKVTITITGTVKNKSGSSKTLKYKIIYDRENINADFSKVSND